MRAKRAVRPGKCHVCGCDERHASMWRRCKVTHQMVCSPCGLWSTEHGKVCPRSVWSKRQQKRRPTQTIKSSVNEGVGEGVGLSVSVCTSPPLSPGDIGNTPITPTSSMSMSSASNTPVPLTPRTTVDHSGCWETGPHLYHEDDEMDESHHHHSPEESLNGMEEEAAQALVKISQSVPVQKAKRARYVLLDAKPSHLYNRPRLTPGVVPPPGLKRISLPQPDDHHKVETEHWQERAVVKPKHGFKVGSPVGDGR